MISEKIRSLLPNDGDDPEKRYFKTLIYLSSGLILVMLVAGILAFFLTLRSTEQTMVPDLSGMELGSAMVELQQRDLLPWVQLRYSQELGDRGTVLSQSPRRGAIVRAKSIINLVVSRGTVIDQVENYIGWNVNDLDIHLKSMVSIHGVMLSIDDSIQYVFNEAPAGTIIHQDPQPGTDITQPVRLKLVVSSGPQGEQIIVPDFQDEHYLTAIRALSTEGSFFIITARPRRRDEAAGTVVNQTPSPGSTVPADTLFQLTVTHAESEDPDMVFGILERRLPNYPIPARVRVEVQDPEGERRVLYSFRHNGGLFSIPFFEKAQSTVIVLIEGVERFSHFVEKNR